MKIMSVMCGHVMFVASVMSIMAVMTVMSVVSVMSAISIISAASSMPAMYVKSSVSDDCDHVHNGLDDCEILGIHYAVDALSFMPVMFLMSMLCP
jgi:hypothetical protein